MSKLRHRESWYSRTKKELEEMDYKEKYEKALEWMKSVYSTMQGSDKEDAEHYFPELTESEDERIRKHIVEILKRLPGCHWYGQKEKDDCLAYLEKQKEQPQSAIEVLVKAGLKPYKDGDQWCILAGDNIQEGICGFGNTIDEALYQFLMEILENQKEQKDYRKLYKGISQSEWFKKAYAGKSLGEEEKQKEQPKEFTHHEVNESLIDAVTHQMEDDGNVDDFARRGIDDIALKYAELGATWQKEQKPADGKELLYVSNKSYNIGYRDGKRAAEQKPAEGMEYSCSDCGTTSGCTNNESECDKRYQEGITYALGKTEQYTIGSTFMGLIPCWVNAPSTLQPAHKYHGRNAVIMHENNGGFRCCFIHDDKPVTIHLPEDTLFVEGWRKNPKEWSEEDERMSEGFMHKLEVCDLLNNKEIAWAKRRLNSLHPQPKQEWSEEDKELLDSWLDVIDRNDWRMDENFCKASREFINRLKSLHLKS